mmetsp:Transcript_30831/g.57617  ORF Transcript_30831/g.57617 Transcript_30831/m.57617 type:complete len:211 (+) Transcript_30831:633-1265(+)
MAVSTLCFTFRGSGFSRSHCVPGSWFGTLVAWITLVPAASELRGVPRGVCPRLCRLGALLVVPRGVLRSGLAIWSIRTSPRLFRGVPHAGGPSDAHGGVQQDDPCIISTTTFLTSSKTSTGAVFAKPLSNSPLDHVPGGGFVWGEGGISVALAVAVLGCCEADLAGTASLERVLKTGGDDRRGGCDTGRRISCEPRAADMPGLTLASSLA